MISVKQLGKNEAISNFERFSLQNFPRLFLRFPLREIRYDLLSEHLKNLTTTGTVKS